MADYMAEKLGSDDDGSEEANNDDGGLCGVHILVAVKVVLKIKYLSGFSR